MLNYQRLWQFWGFLFLRWNGLHWVPSGVIIAMAGLVMFDCQGYRILFMFIYYRMFLITPKMKTRGTAERRLLSLGHYGSDCDDLGHRKIEFLPSGFGVEQTFWGMDIHRKYIYILYYFFCYHARRQKSHIPGTMYRSKPWQFYWSFDLCQKFPYWISCFSQKSTESSVGNPPGTSYAVLCFPGKSDRSRDYLIGQQVTIYYPQWISMGNIYLWNMGNISMISMKVFINRTLFFPNRLIFVDSHYSQSYHVWILIFLQNPPIMPISL